MASGPDRLKQHLIGQALAPEEGLAQAEVIAVDGGIVTVLYQGSTLQYPYLSSYTPVVGHQVAMARYGGNWLILGAPYGFPT